VISQSGSFKKLLLYLKDFVEYNHIYVPDKINYDEVVNSNYHVRLDRQLNFSHNNNGRRGESQVAGNANRQGQSSGVIVSGQQGQQNGFINMGVAGQQSSGSLLLNNQQVQIQSNKSLGYQSGSQPVQLFSNPRIP
jgi:hypothetical protein